MPIEKSFLYDIGEYNPDAGWAGNSGIGWLNNMNPAGGVYNPGPAIAQPWGVFWRDIGSQLFYDGEYMGGIIVPTPGSDHPTYIYALAGGTYGYKIERKFVKYSDGGIENGEDITPASGWSQGTGHQEIIDTWGVQFTTFGVNVFCTDGISGLHKYDWTAASNFTIAAFDAESADPIPKVIASHGGHMILGNINLPTNYTGINSGEYPNLLWWSEFDGPENYGTLLAAPQFKGSDYKFLYDTPGGIIQIVPAGDVVFVFKEKAIYIGEGPPFRWNLLSRTIGTQFPNSCAYYAGAVYFMSDSGPARVGRSGEVELLLTGKAQRTLIGTGALFTNT